MSYLSLDLGGSHAAASLVEADSVIASEHLALPDTRRLDNALPAITSTLAELAACAHAPVQGLGIGFCGLVDRRENRVTSTNGKYEDALRFDFDSWARSSFGVAAQLENDARLALRGEMYAGAARNVKDVVMFTLGTGIGGVAAMNGEPLIGVHGQAGVLLGHVPVCADGRRCTCGGRGCAEAEASGWALPEICRAWPGFSESMLAAGDLDFRALFSSAAHGDRVACEVRDRCIEVWGMMTVAAVHAFDPSLVVFGGGVMAAGEAILPVLQRHVDENTWTPWGKAQLVKAALGNQAAALGVPTLFGRNW